MKLPSIKNLAQGAAAVIKRFPFEMLFAFTGTIAATTWIELAEIDRSGESWCARIVMIANLGLLLSLAVNLYSQSKKTPAGKTLLFKVIAAVFAIALIFILDPYYKEADRIRFFLLSLSFHLLVAFAGFTAKGRVQGFWQFNKALFLRILTSALYSGVLFAGIAAAMGAMNYLFTFKFEWDSFLILWIWIVGMFNTLFFLAGVPADLPQLDEDTSYPKGLKIFTQFVLIPLATLYVIILLAYEVKIGLQWNLPKGLVSNLILGYAVFGFLSVLLVYPIREEQENKWIKTYARSFYFLMLPLIVLLFLAVGTRVFRYGITEERYFLIVLAVWLLFITLYFLISRKQNIKMIPISLCLLTLLAIYGPQSAFSVSRFSQQRILINIFKKNNAFKNGKLVPVDSMKISSKDGNHAVATLDYLVTHHDLESVAPYINADLKKVGDTLGKSHYYKYSDMQVNQYALRYDKLAWIKKQLHLNRFSGYEGRYADTTANVTGVNFESRQNNIVDVKGYDYYINKPNYVSDTSAYIIDNIKIAYKNTGDNYTLAINDEKVTFEIRAKLNELLKDKAKLETYRSNAQDPGNMYTIPPAVLNITKETAHYLVTFKLTSVNFTKTKNARVDEINFVEGCYLIKVKNNSFN